MLAQWMTRHGASCHLRAGATLFVQGHPCHDLYWLESGTVMLRRSEGTSTDVIVGFRGDGTLIGAHALTPDALAPYTVTIRTSARLWCVEAQTLDAALDRDPALRAAVLACILADAADHTARCGALGCLDAREHLERLLSQFVKGHAESAPVRLPLSTGDIAGLVGIDHSHASRLLRTMRHEGLIDVSRGWIIVPNPALLNRDTRQMHDPHWQLRKTAPASLA